MNTLKNVGGLTQKWLAGFAILALVVGAAFVACDKDGDDDSGNAPKTPETIRGVWKSETGTPIKIGETTLEEGMFSGTNFVSLNIVYTYKGETSGVYKFTEVLDYYVKLDGNNLKVGGFEGSMNKTYTKVTP